MLGRLSLSKLLDFVPVANKSNNELMSLYKVHKEELEKIEISTRILFQNLFLFTSDLKGVEKYEKMLGISGVGTLQSRKTNILQKLALRPPYTEPVLWRLCNSIYGENKFNFTVYVDICALVFEAFVDNPEDYISFNKELRYIIPANICLVYLLQYVYKWMENNLNYETLTNNLKYTYAELSRYSKVYTIEKRAGNILESIIRYMTYRKLTNDRKYTYAELGKKDLYRY